MTFLVTRNIFLKKNKKKTQLAALEKNIFFCQEQGVSPTEPHKREPVWTEPKSWPARRASCVHRSPQSPRQNATRGPQLPTTQSQGVSPRVCPMQAQLGRDGRLTQVVVFKLGSLCPPGEAMVWLIPWASRALLPAALPRSVCVLGVTSCPIGRKDCVS